MAGPRHVEVSLYYVCEAKEQVTSCAACVTGRSCVATSCIQGEVNVGYLCKESKLVKPIETHFVFNNQFLFMICKIHSWLT